MSEIESMINALLNAERAIFAIALINNDGTLNTQTENWDISNDLSTINELIRTKLELGQKGITSISIQGIKYMIVENIEERKIGTNITGKGHIIICPIPFGGTGALLCYISPEVTPRDALFTIQEYSKNFANYI